MLNEPACCCFLSVIIFSPMIRREENIHLWPLIRIIFDHCYTITQSNIKTPTSLTFKHILGMNHLRVVEERRKGEICFSSHLSDSAFSIVSHRLFAYLKKTHTFQLFLDKNWVYLMFTLLESLVVSSAMDDLTLSRTLFHLVHHKIKVCSFTLKEHHHQLWSTTDSLVSRKSPLSASCFTVTQS